MSKTKEEILKALEQKCVNSIKVPLSKNEQFNDGIYTAFNLFKSELPSLLDEYAQQVSEGFARWIDTECVRNGLDEFTWRGDNFKHSYKTSELFTQFKNQQK